MENDSQRNIIILTIVIIGLLFTFAYYSNNRVEVIDDISTYNGFEFYEENGLWITNIKAKGDVYEVSLHYHPKDVENITTSKIKELYFLDKTAFISIDPEMEQQAYIGVAGSELGANLFRVMNTKIFASCTKNSSVCEGRYIVDCNNTKLPVIKFEVSNETKVVQEDNCITIYGHNETLIQATDKLLFELYGIVK
ncbi:hypothetical protein KY334_02330 [Candidatus Woesearchaeota archaeon]|nr:hypothetical protein [Candidatus Woesearchaeota archaeon]